jgi:hypothetical protein
MNDAEKEIRNILLGRTLMMEDGRLAVPQKGEFYLAGGVSDGAGAVRFLGMTRKTQVLETVRREFDVRVTIQRMLQNMGRGVVLYEQPEARSCLIRYILTKPALLTFDYVEGQPVVTAWAPRTPAGLISVRRALKAFDKELPADIVVTGKQAPGMPEGESDKAKRLAKEEKKAAKQAKKEEKRKEREAERAEEQRLREMEKERMEAAASGDFWMMKEGDINEHENGSDQTGE